MIKKFGEYINEEFEFDVPSKKLDFNEAFNKHIKGFRVLTTESVAPYGDQNVDPEERFYGDGMRMENGYKILYFGGGCSGEDCNTTFIVSPDNKLIARENW